MSTPHHPDHHQRGRDRGRRSASSRTRCSASGGTRRRRPPRTSRRSSTTTCSRARTSSACCGGRCSCSMIVVIGLLAYLIWEPFREAAAKTGFEERVDRARRGAVRQRPVGGVRQHQVAAVRELPRRRRRRRRGAVRGQERGPDAATRTRSVDAELAAEQHPSACPSRCRGARPSLQLAGLRYDRQQLTQIITYGRPGTPMPAWGVLSGKGALQEQSIQDLVNYLESIITTSDKAQAHGRGRDAGDPQGRRRRR